MTAFASGARMSVRRRRTGQIGAVILAIVALWVILGLTRAPAVAHDYWAHAHPGATEAGVEIRSQPAIPPFWGINIDGVYVESSGARVPSAMILWVEPLTGFVLVMGQG